MLAQSRGIRVSTFGTLSTINRGNVPDQVSGKSHLALTRSFRITERQKLQVRGEAFTMTYSFQVTPYYVRVGSGRGGGGVGVRYRITDLTVTITQ